MVKGFHGGVWLELSKKPASDRPIDTLKPPDKIYLPLRQHIGPACVLRVQKGDPVRLGQPVAVPAQEGESCALHAPVSGTVADIVEYRLSEGGTCPMLVIDNDGTDRLYHSKRSDNPELFSAQEILSLIQKASIASVGGLAKPLWAKLADMAREKITTLVINAVEVEPYICSSEKLLRESPEDIAVGLGLIMRCTGAKKALLAVSDDLDGDLLADVQKNAHLHGIELKVAKVHQRYPSGMEKYLSFLLFGREPEEERLVTPGFVYAEECLGVMSAAAYGFPQISRVVTVSGDAVETPQNLEVRIGTPVRALLEHCGLKLDPERVVLGGAMRGRAVTSLDTPVLKQTGAVLALSAKPYHKKPAMCINCGRCARVCPERLMPNYIAMRAVLADIESCSALHIEQCVECGCCAYICPGRMPIVELIKNIKKAAAPGGGLE